MAQASRSTSQEYWRPPNPKGARLFESVSAEGSCWRCGMEYSPGARFCHVCGSSREPQVQAAIPIDRAEPRRATRLSPLRLTLPLTSFICFVLGVACVVGAAFLGVIYKTDTLVDWQAVQVWRIEWLLAALAALLGGLLLKKTDF
jgi:hypothetical protein